MTYDIEQISISVDRKRKAFLQQAAVMLAVILCALAVIVTNFNNYATVTCIVIVIYIVFLFTKHCRKYDVKSLFSREIKGKNLKEHEYNTYGKATHIAARRVNMPHTYANKKAPPLRLNGTVYLELEDGNIKSISGLYKSHMDIYEYGDVLIKYRGTKFPIVVSREATKQPCPICGEINDSSSERCRICGLRIIKQ